MAYERSSDSKVRGDSLDTFVENLSQTLKVQMTIRNAEDELKFNEAVLADNLSLDDQLSYRKEQLKRIEDDPQERARVRGEIAGLKDRVEQRKFSDAYLEKLMNYEAGMSSIDTVISYLEASKASATDQTIKDTIMTELIKKKGEKFALTQQLIANQTQAALNDQSESVLSKQIDRVSSERSKALLAGNDQMVSVLDLQLQTLKKAKAETLIDKEMKNFAVASITGYATATKLLDAYDKKISDAASTGPIKVGDVTYASPQEFWTFKRDSYVADTSNAGFFGRLAGEAEEKINVANSKNALTQSALASAAKMFDSLAGRPELQGYEDRISVAKQGALQNGANLITDQITNKYAIDLNINKAITDIQSLRTMGVNVDDAFTKLITAASNVKQGQVNRILDAAQVAMQNDPSMTPEKALMAAVSSGAGAVLSPEELANMTEEQIAQNFAAKAAGNQFGVDPRTTINGLPAVPGTVPGEALTPGTMAADNSNTSGFKIITIKAGDTLSTIAARELGSASRYKELATLNGLADPNKIKAGATLKIPVISKAPPTSTTQPKISTPAPAPTSTSTSRSTTTSPTRTTSTTTTPTAAPKVSTTPPPAPKTTYQGVSIVDYLGSVGQDSSFSSRAKLAAQKGITNYTGTATQNTQLLKTLRGF